MAKQELSWINIAKAICMMSVYLLHSEAYYGINHISYGHFLQPFYVKAFFFISGYLFFLKQLPIVSNYSFTILGKHLQSILFRLVIPTIFLLR